MLGQLTHQIAVSLGLFGALLVAGCETTNQGLPAQQQANTSDTGGSELTIRSLRGPSTREPVIQIETGSHSAEVGAVAMSRDGRYVVTASYDKTARVWDARDGHLLHILRPAIGDAQFGKLYAVAIHPTKDLVAIGGITGEKAAEHRILFFRLSDGRYVRSFNVPGDVSALGWARGGQMLLATLSSGQGGLLSFAETGQRHFEQNYRGPSLGLAVSADGRQVATTSVDGQVRVYRVNGLSLVSVNSFRGQGARPHGVAFSPNAKSLLVGYRSQRGETIAPSVHNATSGARIRQLTLPVVKGAIGVVAWSADGEALYAAGRGYQAPGRFMLYEFDASSGQLQSEIAAASDSILQMSVVAGDGLFLAGADGAWSHVQSGQSRLRVGGDSPDLRGPKRLVISDDALQVGFTRSYGQQPMWFDVRNRVLNSGPGPGTLRLPRQSGGVFSKTAWRNVRKPVVRGNPVRVSSNEVSRSIAFMSDGKRAVLGSSDYLRLIDQHGQVSWQIPTGSEVWAVNLSGDDQTIVTAMGDGTLRWWRANTGELLMSLYAGPDNAWVLWSPSGYFDASTGADKLVGWSVNQRAAPVADFYTLSRFRAPLLRPDLIDDLLIKASGISSPVPVKRKIESGATAVPIAALPPVIRVGGAVTLNESARAVRVPYTVRAAGPMRIEVRVNGRPVTGARVGVPNRTDGKAVSIATIPIASSVDRASLQIIAIDSNGVSEPLIFDVNRSALATDQRYRAIRPRPSTVEPRRTAGITSNKLLTTALGPPTDLKIQQGRLVVLAIGVSEYQVPAYSLDLAAKDARDFLRTISRQQGKLYRRVESRLLVNEQASATGIRKGLQWLQSRVGPRDTAMVFLAGHGLNGPAGRYFFLPWDGRHRRLAETSLPESTLRESLGKLLGRTLLFLDTCNAGTVGALRATRQGQRHFANGMADSDTGVVVFASSAGRQFAEENVAWGNGAFTGALIDGLNGEAGSGSSGQVTFKSLDFYIASRVARKTEGRQTPVTNVPLALPDFAVAIQ